MNATSETSRRVQILGSLQKILKRSDKVSDIQQIVKTFTDTGFLFSKISTEENQIIYGRRGTGKTHALTYLAEQKKTDSDRTVMIDMRRIGSDGGIYGSDQFDLQYKASRLAVETLKSLHEEIQQIVLNNPEKFNLHESSPLLDELIEAISKTRVVGTLEKAISSKDEASQRDSTKAGASFFQPALSGMFESEESSKSIMELGRKEHGVEKPTLSTRNISELIDLIVKSMNLSRLWILIDEWSDIPVALQPFLAELIKKILLPLRTTVVKIAAIEHRSNFRIKSEHGYYIGMELGADISADICLDDYLVFENNSDRSVLYFKKLFYNHVRSIMSNPELAVYAPLTSEEMLDVIFASDEAFEELVRAAEGVPRDAIHILGNSIQSAFDEKISVAHVREAARLWYERDKLSAINANDRAAKMLMWIFEQVIGKRRAKAFLMETSIQNDEIDFLFDHRVLHVLKRAISAQDMPGKRFMVYGIDYGCYVDLLTTGRKPLGYLLINDEGAEPLYSSIPKTDMRSVRRSILVVDEFETYFRSI